MNRWSRAWAVLCAVALLTCGIALPAHAADQLTVTIDSVSPAVLPTNPDAEVTLRGTVTNTTSVGMRYLAVNIWRSVVPINSTADLEQVLAGEPTTPRGAPLDQEHLGNLAIITREEPFAPGASTPFEVRATLKDLGLTQPESVYLLGVQVRALPGDKTRRTVGRARVPVALTRSAIPVSTFVSLSAPPTLVGAKSFTSDALASALTGGLRTLLASAERPGVATLLDPSLYEAVTALTTEHDIAGTPRPPNGDAIAWLKRVDALVAQGRVHRLPYGNPDLTRSYDDATLDAIVRHAAQALPDSSALRKLKLAVVAPANEAFVSRLAPLAPSLLIAPNLAGKASAVRDGNLTVVRPALVLDSPFVRLATDYLSAREAAPSVRLVQTAEQADAEARETNRAIVALATPEPETARFTSPERPSPDEQRLADVRDATSQFSLYRDLTGDTSLALVGARVASNALNRMATQTQAHAYLGAATSSLPDLRGNKVKLRAASAFVMSAETNQFPITVTNELDRRVKVRVAFTSENPQRIDVPDTGVIEVGAGDWETVNITPEATGNSVTVVQAQLETSSGEPIGAPIKLNITATNVGNAGWVIILVSGLVLIGATAVRIRAVQREASKQKESA